MNHSHRAYRAHSQLLWVGFICAVLAGCATRPPETAIVRGTGVDPRMVEDSATVPTEELHGAPSPTGAESAAPAEMDELAPTAFSPLEGTYRIGPGDVLEFRSFDDPDLNQEVTVRYDGNVSLPLIPDVNVGGATRDEALAMIEQAYLEVFKDPQVSLTVRETNSKSFFVMGDVMQSDGDPRRSSRRSTWRVGFVSTARRIATSFRNRGPWRRPSSSGDRAGNAMLSSAT